MELFSETASERENWLTQLDAAIGDGDHGANLRRGMKAVVIMLGETAPTSLAGQFRTISSALTTSVGGASGPLYGTYFLHCAQAGTNKNDLTLGDFTLAAEAGYRGIVQLGKASVGDKTMVDGLAAGLVSLRGSVARREPLRVALRACAVAMEQAAVATIPLVARRGRASYLGERSAGHQDPGAASAALLFQALADALEPAAATSSSSRQNHQPTLASL
jgi:dihydroxyacetone kinase-like protein